MGVRAANFDIVLNHFSRSFRLYTHTRASSRLFYVREGIACPVVTRLMILVNVGALERVRVGVHYPSMHDSSMHWLPWSVSASVRA